MVERTAVWPVVIYEDARAAIRFLVDAFGFKEVAVYPPEVEQPVVHAELHWSEGGGVMLGSSGGGSEPFNKRPTGVACVYLVTNEPDALHERVVGAGGEIVVGLKEEDYDSRGFTARDPEGNLWSFGTYAGE